MDGDDRPLTEEEDSLVSPVEDVDPEVNEDSDDEFWEPVRLEPEGANRISPHAIAALVVGALSTWPLVQTYVTAGAYFPEFLPVSLRMAIRVIAGILPAVALAVSALWLAGRADEEIYVADGQLGGVGLVRAGRILAIISLAGVLGLTALSMTVRISPESLDNAPEVIESDEEGGVVFGDTPPPPPAVPAQPAVPAP